PGNTATAAAFQNNGTDRVGGQPAANFDPEERHPTITPGPAEEEDRQEVDDRGLTTDTGSSD
ncbi:hypothetical protein, partial [Pseudarthrobacter sp. NPDC080039]|uniref:hypothetical protein n=1 Tax=unclassified Pseudarthrobacter TaxID=2647000 RepID=UPI00344E833A